MAVFSALLAGIALFIGASALSPGAPPVPPAPPVIGTGSPFVDRLATHDKALWSISGGWSNGPYMLNDWRRSQTQFANGIDLRLDPSKGGKTAYSSGEVQSRATYGHGYYEATMQAAPGSGVVSGFFTYTGPPFGKPWNEIDVEILGKSTREAVLTYHLAGKSRSRTVALDFDSASALHHYSFDWQPGFIRWYIDGTLVHEETGADLPLPDEAQKLMVHLWATDSSRDWAGPFDPASVPARMRIDCMAFAASRDGGDQCR